MKQRRFLNDHKKRNLYKTTEVLQKLLKVLSLYKKIQSLLVYSFFFSKIVKNGFKSRIHNFCIFTGRSRGVYQKLRVSRISLRQLGSEGLYFGLKKVSW